MSNLLQRFVPFQKVDDDQRMVYGRATDETPDLDNEVVDYGATKKAVEEWSKWRNIREMHGSSAVGIAEEIALDDTEKSLDIGVKVVDDAAWKKVKEGVYKGLSIGGRVYKTLVEKMGDQKVTRIVEYDLTEISLVDRPANPKAVFSLVKRDMSDPEEEQEEEPAPEAEEEPPMDDKAMTPDMVKQVVIDLLKELGLVREQGEAQGFAQADQVGDLQKSFQKSLDVQSVQVEELRKQLEPLAKAEALEKVASDLQKMVGDLAAVVQAAKELDQRLEAVEKMPAGTGPVLREIGAIGIGDQSEAVLKALLNDADDPQLRQLIGQRLADLQIKAVHQSGGQKI